MPADLDRIVAIHEAGHAVAAIRAGLVFERVTAHPNEDLELDGSLDWPELHGNLQIVMPPPTLAVVLLAGACAEAKVRGLRFERVFSGVGALNDREALSHLPLSDEEFIKATQETQALVERDWPAIEFIAAELDAGYELDFDEAADVVAAHDENRLESFTW
jgi:hypothetical protein